MRSASRQIGRFGRRWPTLHRWIKFNIVGAVGIVVQLAALKALVGIGMRVQTATVIAVEMAVLNNFYWHLRYTWKDRSGGKFSETLRRCLRFHLTNGALSLAASWVPMGVLVQEVGLPLLMANVVCIAACSIMNFLMAEVVVFGPRRQCRRVRPIHRMNGFAVES